MNIINLPIPDMGNFLVKIIAWLMQICGSVTLGVVLFTILLKLITLPFDFFSRASMRKNSLKMEEMRPELERLQKQYANDKNLYSQKMMALYKKNGYSMFGSCLPTIVTLVIFIVAINAFTSFSNYQNCKYYYDMSLSYNSVIYDGIDIDNNNVIINDNDKLEIVNAKQIFSSNTTGNTTVGLYNVYVNKESKYIEIDSNKYTKVKVYFDNSGEVFGEYEYKIIDAKLTNDFVINDSLTLNYSSYKTQTGNELKTGAEFLSEVGTYKSAETFRNEPKGFLWVKNIWVTDSPMSHPVSKDPVILKASSSGCNCSCNGQENYITEDNKDNYTLLISKLQDEQTKPNGYFILCIITAAVSLAMQLVMNKSQKAQMDLQTVDGQGAVQSKMMTWMLPIFMAIFSFMYTAAFSIYITISSGLSILNTVVINKIVDKKYKKNNKGNASVVRGRVYDAPQQEKQSKNKKDNKKEVTPTYGDFITGPLNSKKKK